MDIANPNRRDFLKTLLRVSALAGLAGAVIGPLTRNRGACAQANACAVCDQFSRCDLPQALEQKNRRGMNTP